MAGGGDRDQIFIPDLEILEGYRYLLRVYGFDGFERPVQVRIRRDQTIISEVTANLVLPEDNGPAAYPYEPSFAQIPLDLSSEMAPPGSPSAEVTVEVEGEPGATLGDGDDDAQRDATLRRLPLPARRHLRLTA